MPMLQFGLLLTDVWILYFYSTKQRIGPRSLSSTSFGMGVIGMDRCCPSNDDDVIVVVAFHR